MPAHAVVATQLVAKLPPGVFAHAAQAAVMHQDFGLLKRMLPNVEWAANKVATDQWTIAGTCADGSVALWKVGG